MQALLRAKGFLGTRAPLHSDITLLLILLTAVLFTIGWRLAVHKHFEIHRWVQTTSAILNTLGVFSVMIPAFIIYILPGIPLKLLQGDYGLTTYHACIGIFSMLLGVLVTARANGLAPAAWRFKNYKAFMRTSYVAYMLATVIGVILYIVVYITSHA